MTGPLVLDLDHSVGPLPQRVVIALDQWQESLRFGCTLGTMRRFTQLLEKSLPPSYATVMLGSGDFHHLSWPLIRRIKAERPFQVVVLDNHPDNMRYPFGVHCGSWVRLVAMLPQVSQVHVVGITSADIGRSHAWENYLTPLRRRRLIYWSVGADVGWAAKLGLGHAFRNFDDLSALVDAFVAWQQRDSPPAYLSIDKDVFAPEVARTNWDQGQMQLDHAHTLIASLRGGLIGSDINGEVSHYRYKSWWKRRLSAIDHQPPVDPAALPHWQAQQHVLNLELLQAIEAQRCRNA